MCRCKRSPSSSHRLSLHLLPLGPARSSSVLLLARCRPGTVVLRLNCVTQAEPKPRAQKSSLAPGRAADGGSGVGGGRAGGGEGGMSKAELVRSKLEARQREREQQSLARSSGAPPAAAPRRRAAAAAELSPGPSGEALERAEGGGLS